jgi:hypothetical protein
MSKEQKFVDINAPYANNGRANGERVKSLVSSSVQSPNLTGSSLQVLKPGEVADHRKHGNGKDVSDELAVSAPKREKDLHPSGTYEGDGDEVR